jgi:murein L,D-transpeptidase YafK
MQTRIMFSIVLLLSSALSLSACNGPDTAIVQTARDSSTAAKDVAATTIDLSKVVLSGPVDSIHVVKHSRKMYVFANKQLLKEYHISLGVSPTGPKRFQGDMKTPEGLYYINGKNPHSMAHKNLGISYPNDSDRSFARKYGRSPGGDIKIHGMVNGWEDKEAEYLYTDWTWGCIAVSNKDIDELFDHVIIGAPICIAP